MGEPGGLPSMGSHRVGHDKRLAAAADVGVEAELTANENKQSFWGDGNVLKLDFSDSTQFYKFTQNPQTAYLK